MVKSLPTSKTPVDHIWCIDCNCWHAESSCTKKTLYGVHSDNHYISCEYDEREYYDDFYEREVWMCPEGSVMRDPNDDDLATPRRDLMILHKCGNCNAQFDSKSTADACCT